MGAIDGEFSRTCPQFCLSLPMVQQVLSDLRDYKRGNLGSIMNLDSCYYEYLITAENEYELWKSEMDKRIRES